jgi:hypothetical protein
MNLRTVCIPLLAAFVVVWAGAVPASATVLELAGGEVFTSTIKAEAEGSTILKGPVEVSCGQSTVEGAVEAHGSEGVPVEGKVSSLTFGECSNTVSVVDPGSLELEATSDGDGTLKSTGAEITVLLHLPFSITTHCVYTTNETEIGTFTGSITTLPEPPTMDISGTIPRTGGSGLCGSTGTWTGSYKVTSPEDVVVAEAEGGSQVKVTKDVKFQKETETTPVAIENISKTVDFKNLELELSDSGKKNFNIAGTCNGAALDVGKKCTETVECKAGAKNGVGILYIESKNPLLFERTFLTC